MNFETLVIASRNPHKVKEIQAILSGVHVAVKSLLDFPQFPETVETGDTLEENARLKAVEAHARTGLPVIADDSGLEVYYLLGEPGVYSARYAGPSATFDDNNRKLLRAMTQVPARRRQACFRCVISMIARGIDQFFEGRMEGGIGFARKGQNGFGYDPIFIPDGFGMTYAELPPEEKNRISHRSIAIRKMVQYLSR